LKENDCNVEYLPKTKSLELFQNSNLEIVKSNNLEILPVFQASKKMKVKPESTKE